jgi:hypothetical protein
VAWLGSGMDRIWNRNGSGYGSEHVIWAGFPAMAVREDSGGISSDLVLHVPNKTETEGILIIAPL